VLCTLSINCRLPQTPRTPSTAAAHYFDDTFSRGNLRRKSSVPTTPNTPNTPSGRPRRSSTSRSIGNRSIYSPPAADAPDADPSSGRRGSAAISDGDAFGNEERLARERERERESEEKRRTTSEADSHMEKYVGEQLSRIKTEESVAVYEDEFEAQLD
jgi:hypothetical protein